MFNALGGGFRPELGGFRLFDGGYQPGKAGFSRYNPKTILGVNLKLWLRSDLGITLNGTTVSAWADQSGNELDFSWPTAAAQPTYTAIDSNWNDKPSLSFDGVNDILASDASSSSWKFLHDGTGGGLIVVMRPETLGNANIMGTGDGDSGAKLLMFGGAGGGRLWISDGIAGQASCVNTAFPAASFVVNEKHSYGYAYREGRPGNEFAIFKDGAEVGTGDSSADPSAAAATGTAVIGNIITGDPHTTITEIVAFNIYPSATQSAGLQNYFDERYGI